MIALPCKGVAGIEYFVGILTFMVQLKIGIHLPCTEVYLLESCQESTEATLQRCL